MYISYKKMSELASLCIYKYNERFLRIPNFSAQYISYRRNEAVSHAVYIKYT